ncbi:MAG: hypothetical protein R2713_12915 [Ilumatobacteraceae bacterium]
MVGEQRDELVAAEATEDVALTEHLAQTPRHHPQQPVTGGMAE